MHTDAQQPGLRSFIVYGDVPAGCFVHEDDDGSVIPHVRKGEFAVIDPSDCEPMQGELFLIEWGTSRRQLVEAVHRKGRYGTGPNGEFEDGYLWFAEMRGAMMSLAGKVSGPTRWGDGPYYEHHFRQKLVGRVVGIYQPDFRPVLIGRA